VHGRAWAAHAHWLLGAAEEALTGCTSAVALARTAGSPYNLAVALAYAAITHQLRDDPAGVAEAVGELRELCDRYGFAYYREWALVLAGWLRTDGSGPVLARRGIDRLTADEALIRMPYWLSLLAGLLTREGRPAEARATLDAAVAGARAHDDVWWLPEVLRQRAEQDDDDARAVARLDKAARLAASHGNMALVDRCTHSLRARGAPAPAFAVPPAPRTSTERANAARTVPS
jgi:hypothetical protein